MKRKLEELEDLGGNGDKLDTSTLKPAALTSLGYSIADLEEPDYKHMVVQLLSSKNLSNRLMCELRMAFFVSAAGSNSCDKCLIPFPSCFFDRVSNSKDFGGISDHIKRIPELLSIQESTEFPDLTWKLLHWIFTNPLTLEPLITDIPTKMEELTRITRLKLPSPDNFNIYMFNITQTQPKPKFAEAKEKYGSFYAFHGSSVPNFHSIIHRGLVSALNVRSAHGYGTYLSPVLETSNGYSTPARGWIHSTFGSMIKCIAICEVISSPEVKTVGNFCHVCNNDDHMQLSHLYIFRSHVNIHEM